MPLPLGLSSALRERLSERFSTAQAVRDQHGRDESPYPTTPPDAVVFAESTDDVIAVVRACNEHATPVIAFGAGSSVEGHFLAFEGGVCLDLSRMNRVLEIDAENMTATVQAGATRTQLNTECRHLGLFFPIDPGADASLGGMAATRASGTNAVRYGTMRENTLSLTVVTAEARLLRTSRITKKSSAGYDLTRIFVGSEGTLGIITEVTVRLYPQPETIAAALCGLDSVLDAVHTAMQTVQVGVPVARAELVDALTIRAVNAHSRTGLTEVPTLMLEFHGSAASVQEQAQTVQALARDNGARSFEWSANPEERSRLWAARHHAFFACLQLKPGARAFTTDACVPMSKLGDCIEATLIDIRETGLTCPLFGHVGDGNFHCLVLAHPGDAEEMAAAEQLNQRTMQRALQFGGTCTGEHGVGRHKRGLLLDEFGEAGVDLMRRLKAAWDPKGILNPGKVLPPPAPNQQAAH